VLHLGERECFAAATSPEIIEGSAITPAHAEQRARMGEAACEVARSVDYRGSGHGHSWSRMPSDDFFLHGDEHASPGRASVTEWVTGLDLVEQQLRIAAANRSRFLRADVVLRGHANRSALYPKIRTRVPALDGHGGHLREASGRASGWTSVLVDGLSVSTDYDPMLAKSMASELIGTKRSGDWIGCADGDVVLGVRNQP